MASALTQLASTHLLTLHHKVIKFINKATHTPMWVADERKDEYLAAGHKLAADTPVAKTQIEEKSEEDEEPKAKKPVKKQTTKKR